MSDFHYLRVDVPEASFTQVMQQLQTTCAATCMLMVLQRQDGSYRIIIEVPQAEKESVESAVSRIEGLLILQNRAGDDRQLQQVKEGQAHASLDF